MNSNVLSMISKTQVIKFLYIISNLINVTSIDGTKQPPINKKINVEILKCYAMVELACDNVQMVAFI